MPSKENLCKTCCASCGGFAVATPMLIPVNYLRDPQGKLQPLCDEESLEKQSAALYRDAFWCQSCGALCDVDYADTPELKRKRQDG